MAVIRTLELLVETREEIAVVYRLERRQDAGQQFLKREGRWWEELVERCCGRAVGRVEADADDAHIFGGGVVRVY